MYLYIYVQSIRKKGKRYLNTANFKKHKERRPRVSSQPWASGSGTSCSAAIGSQTSRPRHCGVGLSEVMQLCGAMREARV